MEANTSDLTSRILSEIPSPLATGTAETTTDIKVAALKTLTRLVDVPVQILVTETRRVQRRVGERCRKIFGRFFSRLVCDPVFEWITIPVQVTRTVIRQVTETFEDWVRELKLDTNVRAKYLIELKSLDIAFDGSRVTTSANVAYGIALGLSQEFLGAKTTIDGIAYCGLNPLKLHRGKVGGGVTELELLAPGTATIEVSGNVRLDTTTGRYGLHDASVDFKFDHPCIIPAAEPGWNAAQITKILNLPFISRQIEKAILRALERLPTHYPVRTTLEYAWSKAYGPYKLADNVWLTPNPRKVLIGPFEGSDELLRTSVGIEAQPVVEFAASPGVPPPLPDIVIVTGEARNPAVDLTIHTRVDFSAASKELQDRLQQHPVRVDDVELEFNSIEVYPSDKHEIVFKFGLSKPAKVDLYLHGIPTVASDIVIPSDGSAPPVTAGLTFHELDFDAVTENPFVWLLDTFLHDRLVRELRKDAYISWETLAKPVTRLREFSTQLTVGRLYGGFSHFTIPAGGVGVDQDHIHAYVRAVGDIRFELSLEDF